MWGLSADVCFRRQSKLTQSLTRRNLNKLRAANSAKYRKTTAQFVFGRISDLRLMAIRFALDKESCQMRPPSKRGSTAVLAHSTVAAGFDARFR